jgi:hypothetical protein
MLFYRPCSSVAALLRKRASEGSFNIFTRTEQDVIESVFEPAVAVKSLELVGGFPPHLHGETHSLAAGRRRYQIDDAGECHRGLGWADTEFTHTALQARASRWRVRQGRKQEQASLR